MGWQWRQAASSVADKVFKYRFNQQFAALFYKNGEHSSWGIMSTAAAAAAAMMAPL